MTRGVASFRSIAVYGSSGSSGKTRVVVPFRSIALCGSHGSCAGAFSKFFRESDREKKNVDFLEIDRSPRPNGV